MLTVTDLITYTFCPKKLYAIKRLGYKEPTTKEMALGSVVHESAEFFTKDLMQMGDEQLKTVRFPSKLLSKVLLKHKESLAVAGWNLMDCFRAARPMLEKFGASQAKVVQQIKRQEGGVIEVEVPIESRTLGIRGRIDELRVTKKGVIPVELKTGKVPVGGVWNHHKVQLCAYAMMLQEQGRIVPHAVVTYMVAEKEEYVGLNPFLRDEVMSLINACKYVVGQAQPPDAGCDECEACKVLSRLK